MYYKFLLQFRKLVRYLSLGLILQCSFYSLMATSAHAEVNKFLEESFNHLQNSNVKPDADISVSGTVTDDQGNPLPGVNIIVKGTSHGTITTVDGTYHLNAPEDATLIFSFIGFLKEEIPVNGRSIIDISLMPDIMTMGEVVVVGYGTVKKSDLTGSVAQVKPDDLIKRPSSSVDQLLQGQAAGLQVVTSSGEPGKGATIRIRGNSSLNGSNSPLLVVDGFPWGDAGNLKQINPQDIASIEILKDASASAIYGSRGANGVILITTKKGKAGKSVITFSTMQTISTLANKPDVWEDPVDLAIIDNEARLNAGQPPLYIGEPYLGVYYPSVNELRNGQSPYGSGTYWPDLVYRDAHSQTYTLTASGGNDKTTYSISGNYYDEEGLSIWNEYKRYNGRLNLTQQIHENIRLGTNLIVTHTYRNGYGLGAGRNPIFPVYDENGDYFKISPTDFGHPFAQRDHVTNKTSTIDVLATVDATWEITDWLQFKTQLSSKYGHSLDDNYEPIGITFSGNEQHGIGTVRNQTWKELLNENYFTLDKTFSEIHHLNVVAGFTTQSFNYRGATTQGTNFVNNNLGNQNLNTAVTQVARNSGNESVLNSWIGRASYGLLDRYLLTLTARADGSSKFGANNKWAFFPSAAFAWKIHEESFMANLSSISEAKLRVSYGFSGNQAITPYRTMERLGTAKYFTNSVPGETPYFQTGFGPGIFEWDGYLKIWQGVPNPDLKWETTSQFNVGLDLGLFENRVTITADVYKKRTEDLLRLKNLPLSSGYDLIWVNDGVIENKGFELGFNAIILDKQPLTWSVGGTFTMNRNKVVSIGEVDTVLAGSYEELIRGYAGRNIVGQPMNVFFGYEFDGIIQTPEEGTPGEFRYVDQDENGVIDAKDNVIIGDPNPDFIYSLNTNLEFKRFDLSLQLYGVYGNDVFNIRKWTPSLQLQRWTPDNPTNEYPRVSSSRANDVSSWFVEDGSFLRIQNLAIGYNFNTEKINGISNLRVYLAAANLYTFTNFHPAFDPEVPADGILQADQGGYPRPQTYSVGLNISF